MKAYFWNLYCRMVNRDQEEGASLVEYALLVALIAIACIVAITSASGAVQGLFNAIATHLAPPA